MNFGLELLLDFLIEQQEQDLDSLVEKELVVLFDQELEFLLVEEM